MPAAEAGQTAPDYIKTFLIPGRREGSEATDRRPGNPAPLGSTRVAACIEQGRCWIRGSSRCFAALPPGMTFYNLSRGLQRRTTAAVAPPPTTAFAGPPPPGGGADSHIIRRPNGRGAEPISRLNPLASLALRVKGLTRPTGPALGLARSLARPALRKTKPRHEGNALRGSGSCPTSSLIASLGSRSCERSCRAQSGAGRTGQALKPEGRRSRGLRRPIGSAPLPVRAAQREMSERRSRQGGGPPR
jgi:hypothetical protein